MTPQQFVQNTDGKAVTYDGLKENYGQCEQLVCLFWKDVYGFNCPPIPYAKDLITNPTILENFTVIPVGQEQAWDVAVFGASNSINSPEAGHTDIVLSAQGNGFTGWDSNWGGVTDQNATSVGFGYPAAHQVTHTYNDVIGFLRYKEANMPSLADLDTVKRGFLGFWMPDQVAAAGGDSFIQGFVGTETNSFVEALANSPQFLQKRQQYESTLANQTAGFTPVTEQLYTKNGG